MEMEENKIFSRPKHPLVFHRRLCCETLAERLALGMSNLIIIPYSNRDCLIGVDGWVVDPRLQLTNFPSTLTFNVNNNSDLRMSNSPAYPPWWRLLLQGFWQTRAFQLFLTNHTWAFPRYQTNNGTVATRRMHDGWCLAFMKSINHDQTWRQKSHEMFARKWLKSSVAAMTQLFRVSQKLISCSFLLLEMPTKSRRSLYRSCWVTWVPLFHYRRGWNVTYDIKPPISGPPHMKPPISSPPYQAPHIKPPTISSPPYQAPDMKPPHFKPPSISSPPYEAPHIRPLTISSPWC